MKHRTIFRLSQLLIAVFCALREWTNFLTDIGQYERNLTLALKIMAFPTEERAHALFNRATDSVWLANFSAASWVVFHFLTAALISCGVLILLRNLKAEAAVYNQKKLVCSLGLSVGLSRACHQLNFEFTVH